MKKLLLVLLALPFIGFGQCTGDCRNGFGTMIYSDKSTYVGQFKDDDKNGYGELTSAEGTYKGNWKNGKVHGTGVFVGILYTYDGEYVNGKKHGPGKKTYADGKIEEGTFENGNFIKAKSGCISGNCVNGQGTYTFANGDKYVGEWKDDMINGQGTFTWADGNKYVGEWKDDMRNGQGTLTYANGTIQKGQWIDGVYQ